MIRKHLTTILGLAMLAGSAASGSAAVMNYEINLNPGDANAALHALATVVTSHNTITVTLTNLGINPRSVGQSITGFEFTLDSHISGATLTNINATSRKINKNDTYTDGSYTVPDSSWTLPVSGNHLTLDGLTGQGSHKWTILGQPDSNGLYSNANSSLTNNTHNPSIAQIATFNLLACGVDETTSILPDSVKFWFNTNGTPYAAVPVFTSPNVPEPASLALMGLGTLLISKRRLAR